MNTIRALLLGSVLALGSCASLHRVDYACGADELNPEGQFDLSVQYGRNPSRARLNLAGLPPIELSPTPGAEEHRPGYYSFGANDGVRLEVTPSAVYLHRPGQPTFECGEFIVI